MSEKAYSRLLLKRSSNSGSTPTINTGSTEPTDSWIDTDLIIGEMFLNTADDRAWVRTDNGIYEFLIASSGSTAPNNFCTYSEVILNGLSGCSGNDIISYSSINLESNKVLKSNNGDAFLALDYFGLSNGIMLANSGVTASIGIFNDVIYLDATATGVGKVNINADKGILMDGGASTVNLTSNIECTALNSVILSGTQSVELYTAGAGGLVIQSSTSNINITAGSNINISGNTIHNGDITMTSGDVIFSDILNIASTTASTETDRNLMINVDGNVTEKPQSFYGEEYSYSSNEATITTTTNTAIDVINFTSPIVPAGTYMVEMNAEVANSTTGGKVNSFFNVNGTEVHNNRNEPKDTSNWLTISTFYQFTVASPSTQNLVLQISQSGSGTGSMRRSRVKMYRIN